MKRSLLFLSTLAMVLCGCGSSTTNLSLSANSYDFGVVQASTSVTKTVAVLQNAGNTALQLSPTVSGSSTFSMVGTGGCGGTRAVDQTCNVEAQ